MENIDTITIEGREFLVTIESVNEIGKVYNLEGKRGAKYGAFQFEKNGAFNIFNLGNMRSPVPFSANLSDASGSLVVM